MARSWLAASKNNKEEAKERYEDGWSDLFGKGLVLAPRCAIIEQTEGLIPLHNPLPQDYGHPRANRRDSLPPSSSLVCEWSIPLD
jgi:hypothetical protein